MHLCRLASGPTRHVLAMITVCAIVGVGTWRRADAEKVTKAQKENRRSDAHQIETLEEQWRDALIKGDSSVVDKITTDDFLAISSNGTLSDKQQYLKRISSGINEFSTFDLQVLKVRVQQGSAIATSQAHVIGKLDGRPTDAIFRYTKVYTRSANGTWRVANFEVTRVSRAAAGEQGMVRGIPLSASPEPH
jgi:ketosteroid isomerase-like protein